MNNLKKTLRLGDRLIDLSQPIVMTIINVTPDSFFSGSRTQSEKDILQRAEKAVAEGATIFDVGGYSTRPDLAEEVTVEEELRRVTFGLELLRKHFPEMPISLDTFRGEVSAVAVKDFGVEIINDVSGGQLDETMLPTVAELNVPYILMHMRGTPKNMNKLTQYDDIVADLMKYFAQKIETLRSLGHTADIILDLGFGFAKTLDQNYHLLANQHLFETFGLPILTGISRKTFIYKTLENTPQEALNGTTVANTLALLHGADILRVHDTREAMEAIKMVERFKKNQTQVAE